jgi:hypothetical protein
MNIKNIINSIGDWAKHFIEKILPSSKEFLKLASGIVNFIKTTDANHPELLNAIVKLIPGTFDDYLVEKLRAHLPVIMVKLNYATDLSNKTADELFAQGVKVIQSMEPKYRALALGAVWAALSDILTDSGVSLKDLQKLQQTWYETIGKDEVVTNGGGDGGVYPNCKSGWTADPVLQKCVKDPL